MTKKCYNCKKEKDIKEFGKSKNRPMGIATYCLECSRVKSKLNREKYRDKINKRRRELYSEKREIMALRSKKYRDKNKDRVRKTKDKQLYGLTPEQSDIVENLRINGTCFCCGTGARKRKLFLDHEHETGKIRGILCHDCNYIEGQLKKYEKLGYINIIGWWRNYLDNPPNIF